MAKRERGPNLAGHFPQMSPVSNGSFAERDERDEGDKDFVATLYD